MRSKTKKPLLTPLELALVRLREKGATNFEKHYGDTTGRALFKGMVSFSFDYKGQRWA